MKITFIATMQVYWGGSEELWVKAAFSAIQKGYKIQVLVYAQKNGFHPYIQQLKSQAHSFVELPNTSVPVSLLAKGFNAIKNRLFPVNFNKVTSFDPDVIIINQVHTYSAPFHPVIYRYLLQTKKEYYLISQFNKEHECLSYGDIEKARNTFQKAKKIFFVSERNKQVAEHQLAIRIPQAVIIDNPLNLSNTSYIAYPTNSTIQFASVARLDVNFKAQDILLKLFSNPKWQYREWHFNIYGTGADERYLKELCHFYKLEDRVTFHNQVTDIRQVWVENHILLMPSSAEGKPLALQEAMICGRIAVASDVAGNAELIDHGINGFIAPAFFLKPFEETLEAAWSSKEAWEHMGIAAHEKMLNQLDLQPEETLLNYLK